MFSTGVMVRLADSVSDVSSPLLARIEGWPNLTYKVREGLWRNGITWNLRMRILKGTYGYRMGVC